MLEAAISDQKIPVTEKRFPRGDVLADLHSFTINTSRPFPEVLAERDAALPGPRGGDRARSSVGTAERKRAANACDYDDLLLAWKRLLDESPETAAALAAAYDEVLVDEYQDTNRLQGEIVDGMARVRRNVTVVGDDAQAIYSFRGASFENILGFPERYPDAKTFRLTRELPLDAGDPRPRQRFDRAQRAAVRKGAARPCAARARCRRSCRCPTSPSRRASPRSACSNGTTRGRGSSDLAVLYRAHYQALELQIELTRRGIPYEIRSGVRFFEQRHVKDVLAFLRIVVNPKDELSWKRALKVFPRVGERSAAAVWEAIASRPDPLESFRERGARGIELPRGAAAPIEAVPGAPRRGSTRRRCARLPADAIRAVVEDVYRDFARAKFPNGEARLDDLEQFAQFAQAYDSLRSFLEEVTLFHELSGEDVVAGESDDDRVVLSTVHQAKGLEWSRVIVIGLSEGRFPSYRVGGDGRGPRRGAAPLLRRRDPGEERGRARLSDARARPVRRRRDPGALALRLRAAGGRLRALDRRAGGRRGRTVRRRGWGRNRPLTPTRRGNPLWCRAAGAVLCENFSMSEATFSRPERGRR